jgi:glycosyltransferase involved in cell wall biosynthesis
VNPVVYDTGPNLTRLIAVVPFGTPTTPPRPGARSALTAVLPGIGPDDDVVVWGGGLYEWFDAETVIRAVGLLAPQRPSLRLLFLGTRHPVLGGAGADTVARAQALAHDLGLLDTVVHFHAGWVPYGERDRWLSSAVVGVSAHRAHVETEFSFRTRIVDYLWCGLPVVATAGDELGDLISSHGAGQVVDEGDVDGFATALGTYLDNEERRSAAGAVARRLAEGLSWDVVAAPLVEFCAAPRRAPDLVLGRAERELLGLRDPDRSAGLGPRLGAALQEGGARLVAQRLVARLRRRRPQSR